MNTTFCSLKICLKSFVLKSTCIYKRNIKIAVFLNNALSSFIKYLKQDFFLCFCVNVFCDISLTDDYFKVQEVFHFLIQEVFVAIALLQSPKKKISKYKMVKNILVSVVYVWFPLFTYLLI
jgi:hypothetical protein